MLFVDDVVELLEPNMNGVLLAGFSIFDDALEAPKNELGCGVWFSFGKLLLLLAVVLELFPNPFPNKLPPFVVVLLTVLVLEKNDGAAGVL